MISYELILSSAVLIIILVAGSFNYSNIILSQQSIWFIIPLLPIFFIYFIAILAETSRTPADLQEACFFFIFILFFSLHAPSYHLNGFKR